MHHRRTDRTRATHASDGRTTWSGRHRELMPRRQPLHRRTGAELVVTRTVRRNRREVRLRNDEVVRLQIRGEIRPDVPPHRLFFTYQPERRTVDSATAFAQAGRPGDAPRSERATDATRAPDRPPIRRDAGPPQEAPHRRPATTNRASSGRGTDTRIGEKARDRAHRQGAGIHHRHGGKPPFLTSVFITGPRDIHRGRVCNGPGPLQCHGKIHQWTARVCLCVARDILKIAGSVRSTPTLRSDDGHRGSDPGYTDSNTRSNHVCFIVRRDHAQCTQVVYRRLAARSTLAT